jgi:hypothetical protein
MRLQGLNRYRRIAGASALLGILFYAALIPLHLVSEATTALLGAELADALVICHSGSTAASDHALNGSAPAAPASPKKHCPFCQGFAAFQLAIAPAHNIGIVRLAVRAPAPHLTGAGLVSALARAPQSRGPPTIPV